MKVLDKGFVELVDYMGGDDTIVSAARVSYLGKTKGDVADKKLIRFMMKHGHTSPFEHVIFQWRIKCPIFVRSQWHRHRTWSYNELSRRYTDENIEFYIPKELRLQDNKNKQGSTNKTTDRVYLDLERNPDTPERFSRGQSVESWFEFFTNYTKYIYELLIEDGVTREMARMVLPQNMYTTFYGTVDLHNLMHFIDLRADSHAQWEIQQYALAMKEMIQPIVPWTFEAWEWRKKWLQS